MANSRAIDRLVYYEALFDQAISFLTAAELTQENREKLDHLIEELETYYRRDWRADFEADECGQWPASLKRGVLSEDGLFNLLEDYQDRMITSN